MATTSYSTMYNNKSCNSPSKFKVLRQPLPIESREELGEESLHRDGDVSGVLKDEWVFDIVDKGDREGIIHKSLCQSRDTMKEQAYLEKCK